jgi:hypothetical protein
MPAIELFILLPKLYPSTVGPLILMNTPFYEPFKEHLLNELNEKWAEDNLVIYDYICSL